MADKKENVKTDKPMGPDSKPVVPFDCPITKVQFLMTTEVLNLGMLNQIGANQAILTRADGGVMVSRPDVPYSEFIPFTAVKSVRFKTGDN